VNLVCRVLQLETHSSTPRNGLIQIRPWGRKRRAPPKHLQLFTNRERIISWKTWIFNGLV